MNSYTQLAQKAVEQYIRTGKVIKPGSGLPKKMLEDKAGVFVTIESNGNLRGCIGTYLPTKENIAKEIIFNAAAAASQDYRFGPVKKEELPYLSYTVYVLSKPEEVKRFEQFASLSVIVRQLNEELNPKKYGIIVKTLPIGYPASTDVVFNGYVPWKSGLLLPGLKGVDTIEQQIAICCQKGGIDPEREKIIVYKFTVEKHKQ